MPSKSTRNKITNKNDEYGEGKVFKPAHAAQLQTFEKRMQRPVDATPTKNIRVSNKNAINNVQVHVEGSDKLDFSVLVQALHLLFE